jgi:hypothetical protein
MASVAPIALIPPDVRARLKDLRLRARHGAGGDGLGQHASKSRGAGLEFVQYRAYEPGDEPRRIDWKLFARSDRYFVRESERDSPLTLWLVVDATASMAQADTVRPQWRKIDAAKTLAACAIQLALQQGDRFGLIALDGNGATPWPPPPAHGIAIAACSSSTGSTPRARGPMKRHCVRSSNACARRRSCSCSPISSMTRRRISRCASPERAAKCSPCRC